VPKLLISCEMLIKILIANSYWQHHSWWWWWWWWR